MGTPEFAVYPLKALLDSGKQIVAVVTVPDKPVGRGQKVRFSPVKEFALENKLTLLQPTNLKDDDFIETLRAFGADLQIVVAFRMLPEAVWNMPRLGTVNLHASLLPQYRGAAPINRAIIDGETRTGVTTFRLKHEIDTGDILLQQSVDILPTDNAGALHDKLAAIGSKLVVETVEAIENNSVQPVVQPTDCMLKSAPKIFKDDCRLDFSKTCLQLHNIVRGLAPYPTAWFEYNGLLIKVFETDYEQTDHSFEFGRIVSDNKTYAKVAVADGFLYLKNLQLAGKRRMNIGDLLLGHKF